MKLIVGLSYLTRNGSTVFCLRDGWVQVTKSPRLSAINATYELVNAGTGEWSLRRPTDIEYDSALVEAVQ